MPAERYYIDAPLEKEQSIHLEGKELHHLFVLRTAPSSIITLINGKGALASASVTTINRKKATLKIESVTTFEKPSPALIIAQAIPKKPRIDTILEKGTELGAQAFYFFPSQKGEQKELSPNYLERMRLITIAAMKQCGRLYLPEITLLPPLLHWKPPSQKVFFGTLNPDAPLFYDTIKKEEASIFFIGPEKGFSDEEEELLEKKLKGQGVKLHENTLRTDTASLAALSIFHQKR